jgi:hypothetical protein
MTTASPRLAPDGTRSPPPSWRQGAAAGPAFLLAVARAFRRSIVAVSHHEQLKRMARPCASCEIVAARRVYEYYADQERIEP